ncbi:MAG TPA: DNA polymerase ligase N-terminal domain-containing protein [Thermoanaerobaculia bacterium]|nr:DNA polymerase ligase N-terminal domain-containing protein [Thermoanaerobaculia bacterium]
MHEPTRSDAMADPLNKYRRMRDFGQTPEPSGGKPKKGKLPIFVIQKHRASHLHYDFRLEMEGVLKSWAVPKGPSYDPTVRRLAMMTEDHPYDYAAFEGVIPEGNYGAGNVIIWDEGGWEFLEPGDDPVAALKSGKLTFRMFGKKMFGEWALVKIGGRSSKSSKSSDKGNEWLLLKHRDAFANADVDVTTVAPRSVVSNRLVEEVSGENVWESNRKAAPKKGITVASQLERAPAKKRSSAKSSKKSAKATARPSRAASARTRSSPAGSRKKARPTPRRRLR